MAEEKVFIQVEYTRWPLDVPDDMWACLKALTALGFDGQVRTKRDASGVVVWDIEVNSAADSQVYVVGIIGWVVMLMGGKLQSMSVADETAYRDSLKPATGEVK